MDRKPGRTVRATAFRPPMLHRVFPLLLLAALPAQSVEQTAAELRAAPSFDDEAIGVAGIKSPAYRAFERLRDDATAAELIKFIDGESPMLRAYAFRALVARHPDVGLRPIVERHLGDVERIPVMRGCMRADLAVPDLLYEMAETRLSQREKTDLCMRLIRAGSKLNTAGRALRELQFPDSFRPTLEELVTKGEDQALIALVRYGKREDLALVKRRLDTKDSLKELHFALWAAEVRPDPSLLPSLAALAPLAQRTLREQTGARLQTWLKAVAAQRSKAAADLLMEFYDNAQASESRMRSLWSTSSYVFRSHTDVDAFAPVIARIARPTRRR